MKVFGLNLNEGAKVTNFVVPSGAAFPNSPNAGELFWLTTVGSLYFYTASNEWVRVVTQQTSPQVFTATGLFQNTPKVFVGNTTSNSSGVWTLDMTQAGFTSPPFVTANVISTGVNAYDKPFATITSITNTTVSGTVIKGNNMVVVAGAIMLFAGAQTLTIMAIGK